MEKKEVDTNVKIVMEKDTLNNVNEIQNVIRNAIRNRKATVKGSGLFVINEIVEFKGCTFKVTNMTARKLSLTII